MLIYLYTFTVISDEEKALKKRWEEEFARTGDYARRGKGKPKMTTTRQAITEGKTLRRLRDLLSKKSIKQKVYEDTAKERSFKDNSVFTEILGEEWDLMMRVAVDPAHEFHNLVKDILSLIVNKGSMALKAKDLEKEQKVGRFKDITASSVPWHASTESLKQLEVILTSADYKLRCPAAWPTTMHYFGVDLKLGKGTHMYIHTS